MVPKNIFRKIGAEKFEKQKYIISLIISTIDEQKGEKAKLFLILNNIGPTSITSDLAIGLLL